MFSFGKHCDAEPVTESDTQTMYKIMGENKWNPHAVWVILSDGKVYMAYPDSQKKWERLHLAPRGLDLNDGEFAYAVTDIVRAYGGFAGLTGELHVLRVNESQPVSFEDMLSSGKIDAYDTAQYRFWGLRVLKTKNGAYLAFNDNYKGNYRLYKDGNFVGAYKTTFDLKRAAGLGFLKDQSVTLEDNGGDEFYVFRLGKTYIAQARNRYSGFSKWAPMLNRNLGNEPEFFSLQDGEVAEFKTRAFKVNGRAFQKTFVRRIHPSLPHESLGRRRVPR